MRRDAETILVKRYGRSRLYDTRRACYVTLKDLSNWKRRGVSFIVVDTETGDDVTRVLLA
jgi:polyhydroxyalkanoate synthesis regulator protein